MTLTSHQVLQIAAEAAADVRTVRKLYAGGRSPSLVRGRIEAAAKKLKLPGPPVAK